VDGAALRIVLDTNVVVSALLWRGVPYRLMEASRQRDQVQLFTSTVLLEELAEVLLRPFSIKRLAIVGITTRQVLADYLDAVDLVDPVVVPVVIADDPDDDHVIAAAIAAQADLIVSGDKHLLRLVSHAGIGIVTPAEALVALAKC
jgi:putative PIN family toxin of toxin-antitoxin system